MMKDKYVKTMAATTWLSLLFFCLVLTGCGRNNLSDQASTAETIGSTPDVAEDHAEKNKSDVSDAVIEQPAQEQTQMAENVGSINFFGFYPGMSKEDADALAAQYGLDIDKDHFKESPKTHEVYQMDFSLEEVQLISKGPGTFEELAPIVSKELRRSGYPQNESKTWRQYVYVSTDGVEVQLANSGCSIFDRPRFKAQEHGTLHTVDDLLDRDAEETMDEEEYRKLKAISEGIDRCLEEPDER